MTESTQPAIYQFRLQGHLSPEWSTWFDNLEVSLTDKGETILTGPVADQAALHGLLAKIRDIGLPLTDVNRIA